MYKLKVPNKTSLNVNNAYKGETLEKKINRIVNNKEPIKDGAPIIYTERKDGVQPQYDIRTDRWELAAEAMDKVNKDKLAQREKRQTDKTNQEQLGKEMEKGMKKENGGAEPIQTTSN